MNIAKSTLHVQNRAKSLFDMATNAVASPLQNIILQNPLALHQHELELMQRTRFPRRQKRLMRQGVWHAENGCSKKKHDFSSLKTAPFSIFWGSWKC